MNSYAETKSKMLFASRMWFWGMDKVELFNGYKFQFAS
jgi:hypothetical protein